jgi:hypothetical protein
MLTTTMNENLDRTAAIRRTRPAPVAGAAGFIAAMFLFTMSATEHIARASTSGESAAPAIAEVSESATAGTKPKHETAAASKSAAQATREDYQKRDASSKDVGDFAGGGAGIYIGGSSAAIILLIVLLVILL